MAWRGVLLSALVSLFGTFPAAHSQDAGLVSHWTLDEGQGGTTTDSAGTSHGVLRDGVAWLSTGRIGAALSFDGVDDFVELAPWDAPPVQDALTLALWIRPGDFAVSDARFLSWSRGVAEQDHLLMLGTVDGTGLRFRISTGGVTATLATEAGLLATDRWQHVAGVYDGTRMILYLDGVEAASAAKGGEVDHDAALHPVLGNQVEGAGNRPFRGDLDDVRLYDRALDPEEIRQLAFPFTNDLPVAVVEAEPVTGPSPLLVRFDGTGSYDRDGRLVLHAWSFGDGDYGSGPTVTHLYREDGTYRGFLTVVDDSMVANVREFTVEVLATGPDSIPFTHEVVDDSPPDFLHCKAAGDVDGDGLLDVLAAGAKDGDGFYWYANPGWERATIVPPGVTGFSTDMAVWDVDRDGDLDAVIPRGFDYGETVVWFENPRPDRDPAAGPWTEHLIGDAPAHDVEVADIDGNGLVDVVVRWRRTTLFLQTAPDTWSPLSLDDHGDEGLDLADLDGDGDVDAVLNGTWLENPGPDGDPAADPWPRHVIDEDRASDQRVHVADLDGDGRPEVILAGSESVNRDLAWFAADDPVAGPWKKHTVARLDYVHSLETADFDGDGTLDIVAAEMHQSADPDRVVIYRRQDGETWEPQIVATTGSHNMVVADLDDDGDMDLLGANHARPPLEVWRNDTDPRARLAIDRWRRHVIDPEMPWRAVFVAPALIDDDDLPDVVAGGWWYRNPGSAGQPWDREPLGPPLNNMATVWDFDDDGDPDVLGTRGEGFLRNGEFAWARNDGRGNFEVLTNIEAGDGPFLQGVAVARFRSLEPLQVALSWEDGTETSVLNVPEDPTVDTWTLSVAAPTSLGEEIVAGDIDRDRDLDLLQGLQWLCNTGTEWVAYEIHPLEPPVEPDRVRLADLNADGRPDAVVGYGHDRPRGSLSWYEQPVEATRPWIEHMIDDPCNPQSLDVADLDLDGDLDLVVGEHDKQNPAASRLILYENLGGRAAGFRRRVLHTGDEHHDGTRLFDVEGDGDLDIVSIGYTHQRVLLYENLANPGTISAVEIDPGTRPPTAVSLAPPFPNPFNPATRLRFSLSERARVRLRVYDLRGRLVATLVDETRGEGDHEVLFTPRGLASGLYLARLEAGGEVRIARMLLVR